MVSSRVASSRRSSQTPGHCGQGDLGLKRRRVGLPLAWYRSPFLDRRDSLIGDPVFRVHYKNQRHCDQHYQPGRGQPSERPGSTTRISAIAISITGMVRTHKAQERTRSIADFHGGYPMVFLSDRLGAIRQRIVDSRGSFIRHLITARNVGGNRRFLSGLMAIPAATSPLEDRQGALNGTTTLAQRCAVGKRSTMRCRIAV